MQHRIDLARTDIFGAIAFLPRRTKPIGIASAAEEAGTMAGG
jgi:hypothetical protein